MGKVVEMKCVDCIYRNTEGTLDACPRFGPRYLNGAALVGKDGVEIIDCQKGLPIDSKEN